MTNANFGDDLGVLSGKIGDVEILLHKVEHASTTVGLHIFLKTKFIWNFTSRFRDY